MLSFQISGMKLGWKGCEKRKLGDERSLENVMQVAMSRLRQSDARLEVREYQLHVCMPQAPTPPY